MPLQAVAMCRFVSRASAADLVRRHSLQEMLKGIPKQLLQVADRERSGSRTGQPAPADDQTSADELGPDAGLIDWFETKAFKQGVKTVLEVGMRRMCRGLSRRPDRSSEYPWGPSAPCFTPLPACSVQLFVVYLSVRMLLFTRRADVLFLPSTAVLCLAVAALHYVNAWVRGDLRLRERLELDYRLAQAKHLYETRVQTPLVEARKRLERRMETPLAEARKRLARITGTPGTPEAAH